jgi:hypothetical protein
MRNKIQTYTGLLIDPLKLTIDQIDIKDIAHSLSNICRFGGNCNRFYSVAEHSVLISQILPKYLQLAGLLHDGAEAYLLDIPKPIKRQLSNYNIAEKNISNLIDRKFGCMSHIPEIKKADNYIMEYEVFALMKDPWIYADDLGFEDIDPILNCNIDIECWSPEIAEQKFLEVFEKIS